jgi:hypothetical protein
MSRKKWAKKQVALPYDRNHHCESLCDLPDLIQFPPRVPEAPGMDGDAVLAGTAASIAAPMAPDVMG